MYKFIVLTINNICYIIFYKNIIKYYIAIVYIIFKYLGPSFSGGICDSTKFQLFLESCSNNDSVSNPLHDWIKSLYLCIFCLTEKQGIVITVTRYFNLPDCSAAFVKFQLKDVAFKSHFLHQIFTNAIYALEVHNCFHWDLRLPNILFDYQDTSFKIIDWETSFFYDISKATQLNRIVSNPTKYPLSSATSSSMSNVNSMGLFICEELAHCILGYIFYTGILNIFLNYYIYFKKTVNEPHNNGPNPKSILSIGEVMETLVTFVKMYWIFC